MLWLIWWIQLGTPIIVAERRVRIWAESKEPQSKGELHHSSAQLTTRNKSTSKFEVLNSGV